VYNWNGLNTTISGYFYYLGQVYTVAPGTTLGSTTLSVTPAPGGIINGSFNGPVTLISTGSSQIPGTLSANFSVYRNN
jgi:hypothetical protein